MAKIIENKNGRRIIGLNTDDIIDIVREYQNITQGCDSYEEIRLKLKSRDIYIPEDIF